MGAGHDEPLKRAEAVYPRVVELRRTLHRHPELAFEEVRTAETVMRELDHLGIPYAYGGRGGGVVARIEGGREGAPTVALRADMDALPTEEHTGLPFASEVPGCMHACGHDAHMAMVLGAAHLLRDDPPEGNVVLVFQPAEETGGGARVILRSGALDGVDAIFGGHVTHHYPVGEIMVRSGVQTAQSDNFVIRVQGSGGHGARPHETVDAVVVVGALINALQTLVSRTADPLHPCVVTIGHVRAGSADNVIADQGMLEGTIRTTVPAVRRTVLDGLRRIVDAAGALHGARMELRLQEGYPPVVNSPRETEAARAAARAVVGEAGLVSAEHPTMGAEDFAYYLQRLPGAYVRFGALGPGQDPVALHSPNFDIDEGVLKVGTAYFDRVARAAIKGLAVRE